MPLAQRKEQVRGAAAPKPLNFRALSNAWNDPIAFARELSRYYSQLEASGHRQRPRDWTTSLRKEKPVNTKEEPTPGLHEPAGLKRTEPGLYTPEDMQKIAPGLYAPNETQ